MKIDNRFEPLLYKINFVQRYERMVISYTGAGLNGITPSQVVGLFEKNGYTVKYMKSENFFKLVRFDNGVELQLNISLKYSAVELIFGVLINGERYKIGGSWGGIYRILTKERIGKPIFNSTEELNNILKDVLGIYEDFLNELIENQ